jgi:hypothetical protein
MNLISINSFKTIAEVLLCTMYLYILSILVFFFLILSILEATNIRSVCPNTS